MTTTIDFEKLSRKPSHEERARRLSRLAIVRLDSIHRTPGLYVYMLKHKDRDIAKIGISRDPHRRAKQFPEFIVLWAFKTFDAEGIEAVLKAILHESGAINIEFGALSKTEMFSLNSTERMLVFVLAKYIETQLVAGLPLQTPTEIYSTTDSIGDMSMDSLNSLLQKRVAAMLNGKVKVQRMLLLEDGDNP